MFEEFGTGNSKAFNGILSLSLSLSALLSDAFPNWHELMDRVENTLADKKDDTVIARLGATDMQLEYTVYNRNPNIPSRLVT